VDAEERFEACPYYAVHTHWDHINGFPFFTPAFLPDRSIEIMAGHIEKDQGGIHKVLSGQMAHPFFPVPLEAMRGTLGFSDFTAGDTFFLNPNVKVSTAPLNHPNGATGYRIDHRGKSMCYVTDTEHVPGIPDQNILALIEGSDLVIYDSTYTESEFPEKVGWGHSTWEEGVRLYRAANVGKLAIFHHDPTHDDQFMHDLEIGAQQTWQNAFVARGNMMIHLL
jgi:phosphoribosyl 1,2-cyclic phosphodiesterase